MEFNEYGSLNFAIMQHHMGMNALSATQTLEYEYDYDHNPLTDKNELTKGLEPIRSHSGFSRTSAANIEAKNNEFRDKVGLLMDDNGIFLRQGETVEITLHKSGKSRAMRVFGLPEERSAKLEKALNEACKTTFLNLFYLNSEYAKLADTFTEAERRANLIKVKDTAIETIRQHTGVDVDLSKIHRNSEGKIEGYPVELAWVFDEGMDNNPTAGKDVSSYAVASTVKYYISLLADEGLDAIPNVDNLQVSFKFTAKDFVKVDVKG